MANPTNTGRNPIRQPQPYDYEITEADRKADEGVSTLGDYYDQHGEHALKVVEIARPMGNAALSSANTKTLQEAYGGNYNDKAGMDSLGDTWYDPGNQAAVAAGAAKIHAELTASGKKPQ